MAITYEAVPANEYVSHIDVEQLGNQTLFSVVSGCTVSESAVDMVVTVASGEVLVDGASVVVAGGTLTLVSDPSNKRWCYATVNAAGAATVVVGDPATSGAVEPTKPDPSGKVILKMYKVEAGQTIAANVSVAPNKRILTASTVASVLTTTGDMLYASAPNTLARLAASTTGDVLTATGAGSAPAWTAPASTEIGQSIYAAIAGGDTYLTSGGWLKADASVLLQSGYATLYGRVGLLGSGFTAWNDRNSASGLGATQLASAAVGPSNQMIAGSSTYLRTSTDGGATWVDRSTAASAAGVAGCAIGPSGEMLVVGSNGYIQTSTDGGATWVDRNTAATAGTTGFLACAIGDSGEMLAVGYSIIRTSTDGGVTWVNRDTAASITYTYGCAIGPSGQMLIVGYGGYIRTSTDGGATWTDRNAAAGSPGGTLNAAAIGPSGEMIFGGVSGYLRTSTDGGASWTDRSTASVTAGKSVNGCAFNASGEVIVVADYGYVRTSADGGGTWTDLSAAAGSGSTNIKCCGTRRATDGASIIGGAAGYIRTSAQFTYNTATEFALPNMPPIDSQQAYIKAT